MIGVGHCGIINVAVLTLAVLALISLSNLKDCSFEALVVYAKLLAAFGNPLFDTFLDIHVPNVVNLQTAIQGKNLLLASRSHPMPIWR